MSLPALHLRRVGRGLIAAALGAAVSMTTFAAASPASADALDDGQWWRAAMGVDELQRAGTGKGITVAVIDGPIDSSVPELKGRVASSKTECLAPGGGLRPATLKGVDADHATSMASLIVGSGRGTAPGGRGIAGIAPDVTLRHYAVLYQSPDDPKKYTCGLKDATLDEADRAGARAIQQAVKDGAKVISISLTLGYTDDFIPALLEAYRAGVIVVASTNNETKKVFWPGSGNGVVTVSPVDSKADLDDSAMRRSSLVDFAAPGNKIAAGAWTASGWRSDAISDGSSQATAITAGGLAALWSAHPDATGNQVLQAAKAAVGWRAQNGKTLTWFRRVGANLPETTGKTASYGFGIVSPADAVKLEVESLPDTNPMVAEKGVSMPTAQEIAAATSDASASPSASATTSTTPSASPDAAGASDVSDEASQGSSVAPWLVGGVVVIALLVGLVLFQRRARTGTSPAHEPHNTQNTPAAADGAAATTKEHSHGRDT